MLSENVSNICILTLICQVCQRLLIYLIIIANRVTNFLCMLPVTVARSSFDGVAIR